MKWESHRILLIVVILESSLGLCKHKAVKDDLAEAKENKTVGDTPSYSSKIKKNSINDELIDDKYKSTSKEDIDGTGYENEDEDDLDDEDGYSSEELDSSDEKYYSREKETSEELDSSDENDSRSEDIDSSVEDSNSEELDNSVEEYYSVADMIAQKRRIAQKWKMAKMRKLPWFRNLNGINSTAKPAHVMLISIGNQTFKATMGAPKSWHKAVDACKKNNLKLAEPQDPRNLAEFLVKHNYEHMWWIGSKSDGQNFKWISGMVINQTQPEWHDDKFNTNADSCVSLISLASTSKSPLNDKNCDIAMDYICQEYSEAVTSSSSRTNAPEVTITTILERSEGIPSSPRTNAPEVTTPTTLKRSEGIPPSPRTNAPEVTAPTTLERSEAVPSSPRTYDPEVTTPTTLERSEAIPSSPRTTAPEVTTPTTLGKFGIGVQRFMVYPHRLESWDEAREVCRENGLDLAEPMYPQALADYLLKHGVQGTFWIGGRSDSVGFYWISGNTMDRTGPRSIRRDAEAGPRSCAYLSAFPSLTTPPLNGRNCSEEMKFICEG